jgi:hypothetical protein
VQKFASALLLAAELKGTHNTIMSTYYRSSKNQRTKNDHNEHAQHTCTEAHNLSSTKLEFNRGPQPIPNATLRTLRTLRSAL